MALQQIAAGREFREHNRCLLGSLSGMGRFPTGAETGSPDGGGRKKRLQKELETDLRQEIETLLGRPSIQNLDFEAVEMAARR